MTSFSTYFDLDTNDTGLMTASMNIGGIVTGLFSGMIVDKWGRKKGILISSIIVLIACILLSTAHTKAQFFVGRVVVGIAKAIDVSAVPTYLVELAPTKGRGFIAGIYWACWLLGSIIAAAVGYGARTAPGNWSWRIVCIVMAGPAFLCIALLPFIPESPRWLYSRGQEDECVQILAKFHGGGDASSPLVVAELKDIKDALDYERENRFDTYRAWFKAFISTKANLRRGYTLISLAVFEQTVGSSIITFYLNSVLDLAGITSEREQFAINIGQTCVAFVSAIVGILFIDRIGRIPMFLFGAIFCAGLLACMAGLNATQLGNAAGRNGVIAMVFLFQMAYSSTWTPLSYSYCAEILNFTIRAKGMGFYIIGVVWNIFMAIVIAFTWYETKGLSLEQIDQVFNGVPRKQILNAVLEGEEISPVKTGELQDKKGQEQVTVEATRA
ncbi:MAG: hypothetical protein STHCBS139747_007500 [Sporothrix thermara]